MTRSDWMIRVDQRKGWLLPLADWLVNYSVRQFRVGRVRSLDVVLACRAASGLMRLDRLLFLAGLVR